MEDQLINPLIHYRYDYCFKCSSQAIECYDYFDNPIGYSRLVNAKLSGRDWTAQFPRNKTIFTMKCKSCGQEYEISFDQDDHFPYPTSKNFFLNEVFYLGYKDDGRNFFREKQLNLSNL